MKATIHIPTYEYAFIEIAMDAEVEELKSVHDSLRSLCEDGFGHNVNEWAKIRNAYFNTGEVAIEDYEKCNKKQRYVINEMKLGHKANK